MSMTGLPEGTPIVCRNCGGAMRLEGDVAVVCPFCGTRDVLPAEQAARYLDIKNRLATARAKNAQIQGMDAAFARIFEDQWAFLRVAGIYLAMAGLVLGVSLITMFSNPAIASDRVTAGVRAQLWLGALTGPALVLGIALSFGVALLEGRRHFRRSIRPLLLARPIQMGGHGFACRVCGGPLATGSDVSVTCRFCDSVNLIPTELHGASGAVLAQHTEDAAKAVRSAHIRVGSIATRMEWIAGGGIALSVAAAYALPTLAGMVMGWN
jgi:uncharacterized Zn finger protein (UPF0148 family)